MVLLRGGAFSYERGTPVVARAKAGEGEDGGREVGAGVDGVRWKVLGWLVRATVKKEKEGETAL